MKTKRYLNVRFLICMLAAIAVLGVCAHFLHAFQVKRTAGFLLQQAETAEDKEDPAKAIGYMRRYLALNPHDSAARGRLGILMADDKIATTPRACQGALHALMHALILDPTQHDVRRRAIEIGMDPRLGLYKDAGDNIDRLFEFGFKDAELCGWRAKCHVAAGEYKPARKKLEEAIGQSKKHEEHFVQLAFLLREQPIKSQDTEKSDGEVVQRADQLVEEMLVEFPESYWAHLFCARYQQLFIAASQPDKAKQRITQELQKAALLAPHEVEVLLACAEWELNQHQQEQARSFIEKGIEEKPEDSRFYQVLARLEIEAKQPEAAVAALQRGLKRLPKHVALEWNLAHLYLQQGQNGEAEELIDRLSKHGLAQQDLEYLQCRLLVHKEEWSQAARRLERLYPQMQIRQKSVKDWFSLNLAQECNFLLARCFEGMRDPERASVVYGQIIAKEPSSIAGHLGLARMEWTNGRTDNARLQYRKLINSEREPAAAWIEYCQLLTLLNIKNGKSDWAEVKDFLARASKLELVPVEVALLQCEVDIAENQFDEMRFDAARDRLLKTYADPSKRPVEIWVGLSNIEYRRGKTDMALALLNEAERNTGDRIESRIARIRYLLAKDRDDALRSFAKLAEGVETWSRKDKQRLDEALAQAYLAIGATKEAGAKWRGIAKERSSDVGSRLALFDLALQAGDDTRMTEVVDQLRLIEGEDGTIWKYCKACQLISTAEKQKDKGNQLTEASGLLSVVAGKRSGWHRVPVAQAQILELTGNYNAAIDKYRNAVLLGESNPAVIRRLVVLYSSQRRFLEAYEMLEKIMEKGSNLGDLDRVAVNVWIATNNSERALAQAEKSVSPESKDYRDHIWLGQVRAAANKRQEAEAAFLHAIKLGNGAPQPWVALVDFHVRGGDKPKAKLVLTDAHKEIRRETLALAWCHERLGEAKEAEALYAEALAARPEDISVLRDVAFFFLRNNNRPIALQHLDKIVKLGKGSPEEISQARRTLALLMAASGNYEQTKEALRILGVGDDAARPDDLASDMNLNDELAKAYILAKQSNARQRTQAIAILEKVARQQKLPDDAQFLQAQLYEAVKDWDKSQNQMLSLLAATQEKLSKATKEDEARLKSELATYLTHYCTSLWRRGESKEAQPWLTRLEKLEPDSFRTLATKARLSSKLGKVGPTVKLIDLANKNTSLIRPVALLFEELGEQQEAERMFKKFVLESEAKSPESMLALAQYLGRRDRIDEALTLCEKAWQKCNPEAVAEASVLIIYSPKSESEHARTVATWLERELAKKPRSTVLLSHLGAVRRLQKDYKDVIVLCQRILEEDKKDTTAMNNLAWLLALYGNDPENARKWIERAIELEGEKGWLLDTHAVVLMKLKKPSEAAKRMQEAIAEMPTAHRYFHLAQAHLQADNRIAALSAYERGKSLGLNENTVDPLELADYERLRAQLDKPWPTASGRLELENRGESPRSRIGHKFSQSP